MIRIYHHIQKMNCNAKVILKISQLTRISFRFLVQINVEIINHLGNNSNNTTIETCTFVS